MKKTILYSLLTFIVTVSSVCYQKTYAQWVTNGNNATGASAATPNEFVGTLNNFNLNFKVNSGVVSTPRMTITTNGDVGIGTTAPGGGVRLEVVGGDFNVNGGQYKLNNKQVMSATSTAMRLGGNNVLKVGINTQTPIFRFDVHGGSINTDSLYRIGGRVVLNSGGSGRMQLGDNTVKVGIGTATPAYQFHVLSAGYANASLQSTGGSSRLVIERGVEDSSAFVEFRTAPGLGSPVWQTGTNAAGVDFILKQSTAAANAITVLRSNNNVGVGTGNPSFQLELSTNSAAKPTSSAWTVSSDARLKKNVADFKDGLNIIKKIRPVWFNYTGEAGMPTNEQGIGTIAQELQAIAPYMVKDWTYNNKNGSKQNYLAVDYGAMDFVLTNAIKEQQIQIENLTLANEEKDKKIDLLLSKMESFEKDLSGCCMSYGQKNQSSFDSAPLAKLEQNEPNPFSQNTVLNYFIPKSALHAMIKVYSLEGVELKSLNISTKGSGSVQISANSLAAGTYTYILLIDGKVVDSKQMVLFK